MDTIALAKHYGTLSPVERFKLTAAAAKRGDRMEVERLARSAPRWTWDLRHDWGLWDGLRDVMATHVCEQLAATASLWEASFLLQEARVRATETGHTERSRLMSDLVLQLIRLVSYGLVTRAEAWKLFCDEFHFDGDKALECFPGYARVQSMEETARPWAFSWEEAKSFLASFQSQDRGFAPGVAARVRLISVDTAEELAANMRKCLLERLGDVELTEQGTPRREASDEASVRRVA